MGLFGDLTGDDVFGGGSDVLTGTTGSTNGSGATWTDRVFATGTDYIGQFLDYAAKRELLREQTKFKLAEMQQQAVIDGVGLTKNINATPEPLFIPTSAAVTQTAGGINKNTLMLGALILAGYMLVKK